MSLRPLVHSSSSGEEKRSGAVNEKVAKVPFSKTRIVPQSVPGSGDFVTIESGAKSKDGNKLVNFTFNDLKGDFRGRGRESGNVILARGIKMERVLWMSPDEVVNSEITKKKRASSVETKLRHDKRMKTQIPSETKQREKASRTESINTGFVFNANANFNNTTPPRTDFRKKKSEGILLPKRAESTTRNKMEMIEINANETHKADNVSSNNKVTPTEEIPILTMQTAPIEGSTETGPIQSTSIPANNLISNHQQKSQLTEITLNEFPKTSTAPKVENEKPVKVYKSSFTKFIDPKLIVEAEAKKRQEEEQQRKTQRTHPGPEIKTYIENQRNLRRLRELQELEEKKAKLESRRIQLADLHKKCQILAGKKPKPLPNSLHPKVRSGLIGVKEKKFYASVPALSPSKNSKSSKSTESLTSKLLKDFENIVHKQCMGILQGKSDREILTKSTPDVSSKKEDVKEKYIKKQLRRNLAASKIQAAFRGFKVRRLLKEANVIPFKPRFPIHSNPPIPQFSNENLKIRDTKSREMNQNHEFKKPQLIRKSPSAPSRTREFTERKTSNNSFGRFYTEDVFPTMKSPPQPLFLPEPPQKNLNFSSVLKEKLKILKNEAERISEMRKAAEASNYAAKLRALTSEVSSGPSGPSGTKSYHSQTISSIPGSKNKTVLTDSGSESDSTVTDDYIGPCNNRSSISSTIPSDSTTESTTNGTLEESSRTKRRHSGSYIPMRALPNEALKLHYQAGKERGDILQKALMASQNITRVKELDRLKREQKEENWRERAENRMRESSVKDALDAKTESPALLKELINCQKEAVEATAQLARWMNELRNAQFQNIPQRIDGSGEGKAEALGGMAAIVFAAVEEAKKVNQVRKKIVIKNDAQVQVHSQSLSLGESNIEIKGRKSESKGRKNERKEENERKGENVRKDLSVVKDPNVKKILERFTGRDSSAEESDRIISPKKYQMATRIEKVNEEIQTNPQQITEKDMEEEEDRSEVSQIHTQIHSVVPSREIECFESDGSSIDFDFDDDGNATMVRKDLTHCQTQSFPQSIVKPLDLKDDEEIAQILISKIAAIQDSTFESDDSFWNDVDMNFGQIEKIGGGQTGDLMESEKERNELKLSETKKLKIEDEAQISLHEEQNTDSEVSEDEAEHSERQIIDANKLLIDKSFELTGDEDEMEPELRVLVEPSPNKFDLTSIDFLKRNDAFAFRPSTPTPTHAEDVQEQLEDIFQTSFDRSNIGVKTKEEINESILNPIFDKGLEKADLSLSFDFDDSFLNDYEEENIPAIVDQLEEEVLKVQFAQESTEEVQMKQTEEMNKILKIGMMEVEEMIDEAIQVLDGKKTHEKYKDILAEKTLDENELNEKQEKKKNKEEKDNNDEESETKGEKEMEENNKSELPVVKDPNIKNIFDQFTGLDSSEEPNDQINLPKDLPITTRIENVNQVIEMNQQPMTEKDLDADEEDRSDISQIHVQIHSKSETKKLKFEDEISQEEEQATITDEEEEEEHSYKQITDTSMPSMIDESIDLTGGEEEPELHNLVGSPPSKFDLASFDFLKLNDAFAFRPSTPTPTYIEDVQEELDDIFQTAFDPSKITVKTKEEIKESILNPIINKGAEKIEGLASFDFDGSFLDKDGRENIQAIVDLLEEEDQIEITKEVEIPKVQFAQERTEEISMKLIEELDEIRKIGVTEVEEVIDEAIQVLDGKKTHEKYKEVLAERTLELDENELNEKQEKEKNIDDLSERLLTRILKLVVGDRKTAAESPIYKRKSTRERVEEIMGSRSPPKTHRSPFDEFFTPMPIVTLEDDSTSSEEDEDDEKGKGEDEWFEDDFPSQGYLKKQAAKLVIEQKRIENEIRVLEALQGRNDTSPVGSVTINEIHDKPPPPYSPPSVESVSLRGFLISVELPKLFAIASYHTEIIWPLFTSRDPNEPFEFPSYEVNLPSGDLNDTTSENEEEEKESEDAVKAFDICISDVLKEALRGILCPELRSRFISTSAHVARLPKTKEELEGAAVKLLLVSIPPSLNGGRKASELSKWTSRPRDLVDEILAEELLEEEPGWIETFSDEFLAVDRVLENTTRLMIRKVMSNFSIAFAPIQMIN